VRALVVEPGSPHSTRVDDVPDTRVREGEVPVRPLEIGVCGTDREISEGLFGIAPEGERTLVLGHESIGVVDRDGYGFTRGELVTATVRRSCGHCVACEQRSPDACLSGDYRERGITRLHGFACELVSEDPSELISIPPSLGRTAVLAEPTSICARAVRHAETIGGRQPWRLQRALVIGAGAIGVLSTMLLRLRGLEVWTASLEPSTDSRAEIVRDLGARYLSTTEESLPGLRDEVGGFDLVVEAAGSAQLIADSLGLLRRSGIVCVLGIDGHAHEVSLDGRVLGVDLILENRVLFGSVNARREDLVAAVDALDTARRRWPEPLEALVGLRVPLERFAEAFDYHGVKATLVLSDL
jgi:threonine dehydrogenase-like Zn-dependent dehydrogenase